ncbi:MULTISPECIES: ABC transporter substrate-binding protein [Streptomyces]|jgi:branched-chain amino acid transport system substrate-binding protein|uniref:ABC transporter substrate-binding protein n=1 Tax=Streptomyces doudnae TaxID=3075536 RepID=A0ABD5ELE6_9ACTN|nr:MULTISPECIES: ABC transporter substrate-binding protein [unclassified Streptomyces]MDT0435481.1 ABC transporter substrate-binding protein [Streptomyces sp. DSM 41981]MYQ67885.1 ABC transporter substrate-binding protein [Streptomyces sp. SID4950]SCE41055.1 amino acid/amide ABC transporter substrate-binding protein, HAAT family [Streptomyces sp. SolWspMP-5a-2]
MFFDTRPRPSRGPRLAGAAALALALTAATGCGGPGDASDDTLKVGLVASLSGTYKPVGTELRDGFELYLKTHGGKLGGRKAELLVADEGDGPPTAVPAATKLVKKDKVDVLTGFVSGGSVNAVLPLVEQAGIPFLGSNARPAIKNLDRVWTTSFLSDEPGRAIAPYVKEKVDGPVYAIGPDYQGGYDELRGFTDEFKRLGGELANPGGKTTWTPFPKTTNFLPYLSEIARTDAKAVYCFYAGKAAIDFAKQYAQSDVADLPLYTAFVTEGSVLQAQGAAAKGIYSVLNYAADLDNEANRGFVADWTAQHDSQPTTYAMSSYDAAAVLDKAVADAAKKGEVTPETVNRAIGGLGQIDSPRGAWEFGEKAHSPVQTWYLRQVRPDGERLANVMVEDLATLGG